MDMQDIFARTTVFDAEHKILAQCEEARSIGALLQVREEFPAAYLLELESQGVPTDQEHLDKVAAALILRLTEVQASVSQAIESLKSGNKEDQMVATVLEGRISMNRLAAILGAEVVDLSL